MPTVIPMFQPRGESIMEILMRQGDVAGRAALMRGEAISRGIEGVGNAVAQGVAAYGQKKSDDKIRMQLDDAIGSWDGKDPMGLWRKVVVAVGPSRASQIVPGLVSLFKTAQGAEPTPADLKTTLGTISAARKVYGDEGMAQRWSGFAPALKRQGALFGMQVPDQYTPEVGNFVDTTLEKLGEKPTEPKTRQVEVKLPGGGTEIRIVEDKPGQTFTSAAPPPKPENLTGEEAYIRAMFGPNPTAEQILQGRARYAAAGREPDKPGTDPLADLPTEWGRVATRATMALPGTRRDAVRKAIAAYAGDPAALGEVVRQAAVESENVEVKNQVMGRMATIASLNDTRAILDEMKAKGVPTGWLSGGLENLARRLGKTTNPEYVALGNRLMGTLINYRRAATGVQFSARESADYERMFPNYKNEPPVNQALIDGLLREMRTYDRTYWEHKLGKDGARLVGAIESEGPSTPPSSPTSGGTTPLTIKSIKMVSP